MEKVQYRACLTITYRIQRTSREQLYDELGIQSLVKKRWCNKLVFFYKIVNCLLSDYLYSYLEFSSQENYLPRYHQSIRPLPTRANAFKGTFFPYCINEWNKVKVGITNAKSINIFKKSAVTKKKKRKENLMFCIYEPFGVKLFTSLRLQFSHLNEH